MFTALRNRLYSYRSILTGKRQMGEMGDPVFPKTLQDFGYDFDQGGKLRKIDRDTGLLTEDGFEFNVTVDLLYNQKRYEALGQIIDDYVYDLLEKEGLSRLPVPKETDGLLNSFIFATDDYSANDKLVVLIHGSGVVRAGQWARRLIINDNLKTGTQLPYIKKARELGYAVMVLNTNDNFRRSGEPGENGNTRKSEIPGSGDPHSHVDTVWKQYIQPSKANHIAIVAHSYGGVCVVKFAVEHPQDFKNRIFAVGLTDSVHSVPAAAVKIEDALKVVARNWVSSEKPLDTPERTPNGDIERYSAGHSTHEMTSWTSMESVFRFIEARYEEVTRKTDL